MRIRIAVPEEHVDPSVIDAALEAVTRLDESMIRKGQSMTSHDLVDAGAVWRPEPPGDEHFDHGGTIETRGWGDCDDWAPLHAATLRASGEDPGAVARVIPSGPSTYHAIVERSDGKLEDPSAMAGMQGSTVVGASDMAVWACDPHDGRIYAGSLAPTVGPLAVHCGGAFAIRGAMLPDGPYYEARADMPIVGSALGEVRSYVRGRRRIVAGRHVRGARVVGVVPYSLACIGHGRTPLGALDSAIVGAVLCGDAAEMTTSLDRYKLLAIQAGLKGLSPGEVRSLLVGQITHDVHTKADATGTHPAEHTQALAEELAGAGYPIRHVVGGIFDDIGKIASGVVKSVSSAVNAVAKVAKAVPWGDIVHDVQAAVSAVPGLGTAVSEVIATAETAYDSAAALLHGNPLEAAIDAAYDFALGGIPGAAALHPILDPVKKTLIDITVKKEPVESAVLDGILTAVPDAPSFGSISPRSVAASLAHLIVGHLGVKKTAGHTPKSAPSKAAPPVAKASPRPAPRPVWHPPPPRPAPPVMHPLARAVLANKPPGVPHAAVHADAASLPGTPGAPAGATHWSCMAVPGGHWLCRWI